MLKRLIAIILVCLLLFSTWLYQDYAHFQQQPLIKNKTVVFEVLKGNSFDSISRRLHYQVPHNSFWLRLLAYELKVSTKLKAGEYELPVGLLPKDFLALLSQGKVRQYSLTLLEGWTFKQCLQALQAKKGIKQTLQQQSDAAILKKLGSDYTHAEGLFFPDTYQYEKGMTDLALLKRAYSKMQMLLAQQWQHKHKDLPIKTPYEALILASIIEKETANAAERTKISGVFSRRLQKGMRLQTDPTVIYGMGKQYHGNITKQDLMRLTPYNTYKIKGLPPTPIAMPGKAAIYAALHPEEGESLYFVAKGQQGLHQFSATLAAHNKAVDRYQRLKKP